ncbi:MAG: LamG domain-containing protein, partial [Planctomycetota bacterium]
MFRRANLVVVLAMVAGVAVLGVAFPADAMDTLADIEVLEPGEWRNLAVGEKVSWTSSPHTYRWLTLASILEIEGGDLDFWYNGYDPAKSNAVAYGLLDFRVLSDGPAWVLFTTRWGGGGGGGPWQAELTTQAELEADGWSQIATGTADSRNGVDASHSYLLYERYCTAGEVFSLRTEKYVHPIPIIGTIPELAVLESLEIVGPNEVAEDFSAQYQAIAHYDNGSTRDITGSADWSVDDETIASIAAGLLTTEPIDLPQDVTITASYTEGPNTVEVDKMVSVLTTCPSGSALEFDGVDDNVYVDDSDDLDLTNQATLEAWIKTPANGNYYGIICKAIGWNYREFAYCFEWNKGYWGGRLQLVFDDGANQQELIGNTPILDNEFHHIAATWDGNTINIFIDGELDASTEQHVIPWGTDYPLCIGSLGNSFSFFEGVIDDVRIFNRALSPEEIWANMHRKLTSDDPNLVGYWNFDEGEGQVAHDLSNSNNHGQLGSTPEIDSSDPNWVYSDALATICYPPVAVAAGPNEAVVGDSVLLDGSGSFDADGDILTFSWRLISKPSGSIAEITDPNSEQTTFIPDVPGEYTAGLVVSDDYFDSEEDEVNITVISLVDAIEETLGEAGEEISNLDPNTLKNSNMTNA